MVGMLGGQLRILTHYPIAGHLHFEREGDPFQLVVHITVCLYGVACAVKIDDPSSTSRNGTPVNNPAATVRVIIGVFFPLPLQGLEPLIFHC